MDLTHERINECVAALLENSEINEALKVIKGEDADENEKKEFLSKIVECLILQKLVESKVKTNRINQGRDFYHKRKDVKKKNAYQLNDSTEKSLTFAVGIKEFFNLLDYTFKEKETLLKAMRKYFKNYKFKEKNIINDYSILFFTFKMFDIYWKKCANCKKSSKCVKLEKKSDIAEKFAQKAYEALKNPYNKKRIYITSNSLYTFCKHCMFDEHRYLFTLVFVSFIQALNKSAKMDDWIKYSFYERFHQHIILINSIIPSIPKLSTGKRKITIHIDPAKLSKHISNKLQYLNKKSEVSKVKEIIKIRKLFQRLPESSEKKDIMSKKEFHECCMEIFNLINNPNNYNSEIFTDIIIPYLSLPFETEDSYISYAELIFEELGKELPDFIKSLKNEIDKGNIYIDLIMPPPKRPLAYREAKKEIDLGTFNDSAFKYSQQYKNICDKMISNISEFIHTFFYIDWTKDIIEQYSEVIGAIKLNEMNIPILEFDISKELFNDNIECLALYSC